MNKQISLLFILIVLTKLCFATDYSYAFLVTFSDKNNSSFSIDKPEKYLSQRAIDRRVKFSIAITTQDLPVNQDYIDEIIDSGGVFHNSSKWMNSAVFYTNDANFDQSINNLPFVSHVTIVYNNPLTLKSALTINKFEAYAENTNTSSIDYGYSDNQISMCNTQYLHNQGYQGEGMQIAVIDAGFYRVDILPCFQPLFDNNQILATYDFVDNEKDVYGAHNHGTSVMSILAANEPGLIYGTAAKASYYLLRSEDGATEFRIEEENWIAAAEFADSAGADVISTSLGYSVMDDPAMSYAYEDMDGKTTRITQGSEIAFTKGMILMNSAGNEGLDKLTAPSDGFNTMGIGAVDSDRAIATFSSRGPSFDGRIKPDVSGQGAGTAIMGVDTVVYAGSGTSFSCPLLAGMITCLWQANPNLSNAEITNAFRKSGDNSQNPDEETGYGIPDLARADDYAKNISGIDSTTLQLLDIYPNPFIDELELRIYTYKYDQLSIEVYDGSGKFVFEQVSEVVPNSTAYITIDEATKWSRGVYVVVIRTGSETLTQKIIKS